MISRAEGFILKRTPYGENSAVLRVFTRESGLVSFMVHGLRKAKGGDDWKVSTKDVEDEKTKSPTSSAGLARRKKELGMESQQLNVQELAEFIHTFYDRESGTFPKGPEGVAIMVGKKFGEQAEMVARKMVERMAPQQQDPQIAELARIRELAGY